jgi:hypothetical protein
LIPKKSRIAICSYLFKEGVASAAKETMGPHPDCDVPSLHMLNPMKSLKSRG